MTRACYDAKKTICQQSHVYQLCGETTQKGDRGQYSDLVLFMSYLRTIVAVAGSGMLLLTPCLVGDTCILDSNVCPRQRLSLTAPISSLKEPKPQMKHILSTNNTFCHFNRNHTHCGAFPPKAQSTVPCRVGQHSDNLYHNNQPITGLKRPHAHGCNHLPSANHLALRKSALRQ